MNGESNLIPFSERSKEEARECGRKGGIASGETRRRKRTLKDQFELLLSLPIKEDSKIGQRIKEVAEDLGIPTEELDNQMAMCINMFSNAMSKNPTQAFASIQATIGEKPAEKIEGSVPVKIEMDESERELLKNVSNRLQSKN